MGFTSRSCGAGVEARQILALIAVPSPRKRGEGTIASAACLLQMLVRRVGSRPALRLGRRDLGALHATVLVVDEAFVIACRRHALAGRAALERHEVVVVAIVPVGRDQVAVLAARRDAVA